MVYQSLLYFMLLGSLVGCGVERPHVAGRSLASSGFNHTGITNGCKACHGPGMSTDRFPATHVDIQARDCSECHNTTAWKGTTTNHNPPPTQCASCHGDGAIVDRWQPTHRQTDGRDCIQCHTYVRWNPSTFTHSPLPTSCNSCHENQRPLITVYPKSTTQQPHHYNAKDCYRCHKAQATFSFAHYNAAGANINFCLPCHDTPGARNNENHRPEYFVGDGTCYNCHYHWRSFWAP